MRKLTLYALIVVFSLGNINCKNGSCRWAPPPNVFYFLIEKNGEPISDSILSHIKMYYFNSDGIKISDPDGMDLSPYSPDYDDSVFIFPASRSSPNLTNIGVMESGYVYGSPPETWYLEYPNGDIDTVYVEATKISCKEGQQNRCYCQNPYTTVKFNGHDAPEVTDLHTDDGKPIFLFEK